MVNADPARRSARLRVRLQSGGVAVTAWALAAKGRGNPDKMRMDQAKLEPDWDLFDAAIQAEVDALWENGTWELVDLPRGKKLIQTVMLYERKRGADGEVTKHKGRYVVRGDTQTYMDDYFEVWAPVARYSTLRVFLAFCASRGLGMEQMDVATAFLNGDVEEEIYIPQPRGYERGTHGKVCKLKKALSGLKQAARAWNHKLKETLGRAGFTACDEDPCLFVVRFADIPSTIYELSPTWTFVCISVCDVLNLGLWWNWGVATWRPMTTCSSSCLVFRWRAAWRWRCGSFRVVPAWTRCSLSWLIVALST